MLAAGGNNGVLLAYRNTGTRRCWIRGYIRATVYGAAHAETAIDHPSVYVGGLQSVSGTAVSPRTVPTAWLSHGEAAYEILGGSDTPMGAASTCPTATSARIRLVFEDAFSSATVSLTVALPEWWLCIGPIATPIVPFVSQHYGGITYHQRGSYFVP